MTDERPLSVCGVSIMRAYAVATVSFTDRTYAYASTLIWTAVEVNVGITSGCLPVLQPVVHVVFGKVLGTNGTGHGALRGAKSTQNSGRGAVMGGPFRRLDENLVQVQGHAPGNSAWAAASTPVEREVQMDAIHVKRDVDLDRGMEEV